MSVIDFKSVGVRTSTFLSGSATPKKVPIGIVTPLRLGDVNGDLFEMHTSLKKTLNDNFKNMVLTNHGERLAIYDFGANLLPLTLDLSAFDKEDFGAEAVIRIKTTTSKYMPFLELKTFESKVDHYDNKNVGKIKIRVTYDIPRLQVTDQIQEVTLFVGG